MGLLFIGAPCTVCSRAMLIMQLLDVLVVLECNVFVFFDSSYYYYYLRQRVYVFAVVSLSAERYLAAH